jgi:hypothetical protein
MLIYDCMNTNGSVPHCPVCGGAMRVVGKAAAQFERVARFRCTCGHVEDRKDTGHLTRQANSESVMPEGIQDNLSELSLPQ